MRTESLKYLFENLKNGDAISFYHKKWYFLFSRLIFWVTRNKEDHSAGVFDVEKSLYGNFISFRVGEQMISGRSSTKYVIQKMLVKEKWEYWIDSRFKRKSVNFFYRKNKCEISEKQNEILAKYWAQEVDYEFSQLPFEINWFYRLFGDKNKIYDRFCSAAFAQSMRLIGFSDFDSVPSPKEIGISKYFEPIILIDAR